jgi:hypothetical protein
VVSVSLFHVSSSLHPSRDPNQALPISQGPSSFREELVQTSVDGGQKAAAMIGPHGMEAGIDPGRARAKIACPCQGIGGGGLHVFGLPTVFLLHAFYDAHQQSGANDLIWIIAAA